MSIVDNLSAVRGTQIDQSYLNDKFDDINDVTTSLIDDDNVRSEGIDRTSLHLNGASTFSGIVLVDAKDQSNAVILGAGTAYTNTANHGQKAEINHGSGTRITWVAGRTLEDSDLLRVYWHVHVDDIGYTVSNTLYRQQPCWLVWLEWDITSNSLANWVPVTGQGGFNTLYGDGTGGLDAYGSPISTTSATMTIPHYTRYYDNAGNVLDMGHENSSYHRAYFYQNNTGNTITIYGLRIVIDGLYFPWRTGTVTTNRFIHVYSDTITPGDTLTIGPAYMVAIVQRGE